MADNIDNKADYCISFIVKRLKTHSEKYGSIELRPFFLGVNGVQGVGKTTLVSTLAQKLSSEPQNLRTVVLSIDDFYLPHSSQQQLARAHSDNPLIQHRGQPGTHDLGLATSVFQALRDGSYTKIPAYDKSAFNGEGDRIDPTFWAEVNIEGEKPVKVVIFEGWCVGFRALDDETLHQRWIEACEKEGKGIGEGRLGKLRFEDLSFVNQELRRYDDLTTFLDALIHIDAEDPRYVYQWRQEAEAALRRSKGAGMTDEQVKRFVDGYYPAYELYTDALRRGAFKGKPGRQLRLLVDRRRLVKEVEQL